MLRAFSNLSRHMCAVVQHSCIPRFPITRSLKTSAPFASLMEFFDEKDNWGSQEIKHGRSWKLDELRIKSNSDLHKLWYVLLKERNMLFTMEEAANEQMEYFPNPERIDKVEESMKNLEEVVRERNRAYMLLETGEDGERPKVLQENAFGLVVNWRKIEHIIPRKFNKSFRRKYPKPLRNKDLEWFLSRYQEKQEKKLNFCKIRASEKAKRILRLFPDTDREALQKAYPLADIPRIEKELRDE